MESENITIPLNSNTVSFVFIQHLEDEQIIHSTNIKNSKSGNKYLVDLLRALADRIEASGQIKDAPLEED